MRLNRYIAQSGHCSRRKADELIAGGQVLVNGRPVLELGSVVDPTDDRVVVEGKRLKLDTARVYVLLYKPRGVVTTLSDPQGRPTVASLVELGRRVVPVGRLDLESSGALLLTDDGDLCNRLLHPSSQLAKDYLVLL
ncbi:MAG: rRNA pseudouridine synthase, partial [Candidatus Cloacimonetes bacterium]|nr:rRNA pseudouridine synthase [Candidatus Cloacimonadota bacterium]